MLANEDFTKDGELLPEKKILMQKLQVLEVKKLKGQGNFPNEISLNWRRFDF
jgi:hypothetical protein